MIVNGLLTDRYGARVTFTDRHGISVMWGGSYDAPEELGDELDPLEFPLLSRVDIYSDTMFNSVQAERLARELEAFAERVDDTEERERLDDLIAMCALVKDRHHLLLIGG